MHNNVDGNIDVSNTDTFLEFLDQATHANTINISCLDGIKSPSQ